MKKNFFTFFLLLMALNVSHGQGFQGVIECVYETGESHADIKWFIQEDRIAMEMTIEVNGFSYVSRFIPESASGMLHILSESPNEKRHHSVPISSLGPDPRIPLEGIQLGMTEEAKDIRGYNCQRYQVSGPSYTIDAWVSETPAIPLVHFSALSNGDPLLKLLANQELTGFPIESTLRFGDGSPAIHIRTTSIRPETLPESTFSIPPGFKTVE